MRTFATGASFSFRYTRHIGDCWGLFAQADMSGSRVFEKMFFKRLEALDDGIFTYGPFKTGKSAPYNSYLGAFVGAQYIFKSGDFSLRPRAGVGIADYYRHRYRYYRWYTFSSGITPEAVMSYPQDNDEGVETISMGGIVPAVKAGLQAKWYVTDILHLGIDVELTGFMASSERFAEIWSTDVWEPGSSSAIVNILTIGLAEKYIRQEKLSSTIVKHILPPVGSVKFSIGWDL